MKSFRVALAALAVALTWAVATAAPTLPGLAGWERGSAYDRLYDVHYEVVAPSTVLKVETFTPREGMAPGVRAFVVTGPESLWVHLGPVLFLEAQDMKVAVGDRIVVTGAHVTVDGERLLIASHVEKAGITMHLRDDMGRPVWNNWRPRPNA
ncbi:MAG: hypothetical protein HZA61_00910 [Candidatus Eisenbacteria bacterium]|uniref:Magnetosome protein MamS/MamX domain-containing protein n=1 Tax=Eiseniibacteriota bacterium TaxID=2212470 RepID=A0A933SDL0_UNCEI|nr:hypothetical protein [Candidatus Eisenbacteria bacterium]